MEAPHPLLQPAVVGVHVVDMEIWRLRLRRAGCGQDMELDPGASSEGGNRRTPIAARFRWLGDDPPERGRRGGVEPRQDGIDGRAGAIAGDDDWDLLRRQTPLGGFAAPLARCSRQIAAFALEGFEDEGLVGLNDPGQAQRLVEIERGQEPMSPPGTRWCRPPCSVPRPSRPSRRRSAPAPGQASDPGDASRPTAAPVSGLNVFRQLVQRYRGLPPALPGANVVPTAVRTAKARNPTPPVSIAAIAIELAERFSFFLERGDQNRIFVDFCRLADLGEGKLRHPVFVALRKPQLAFETPNQHDHPPLPAPARQANGALLASKPWPAQTHSRAPASFSIIRLTLAVRRSLNRYGKAARLGLAHDPLVAEA